MDTTGSTPHPDHDRSVTGSPDAALPGPVVPEAAAASPSSSGGSARLFGSLAIYTGLRVGLVVVLTAVLAFFMPLIVALMFAIVIQLPLAWVLFRRPRAQVNEAIAVATARRRAERSRLQAGLSGDSA